MAPLWEAALKRALLLELVGLPGHCVLQQQLVAVAPGHWALLQQLAAAHRCTFCHGDQWRGQENVPALAGQREEYLLASLRAYRDNSRSGYDASMAEVVQALSDADLIELAYGIARLGAH